MKRTDIAAEYELVRCSDLLLLLLVLHLHLLGEQRLLNMRCEEHVWRLPCHDLLSVSVSLGLSNCLGRLVRRKLGVCFELREVQRCRRESCLGREG